MRYWDASAIVPLLIDQSLSRESRQLLKGDAQMTTWWGTEIECASAVARLGRDGLLTKEEVQGGLDGLGVLRTGWSIVEPTARLKSTAMRLLRTHRLRAGDALQLASAIEAAGGRPEALQFVCYDKRLNEAAQREGFRIVG